jgi:putative thioredoxin
MRCLRSEAITEVDTDMSDEYVYEVGTADFVSKVVEKSKSVPVLVDFWAEWCAPCRQLGPVLERVVQRLRGKVVLAKVNVEENQALAQQLRISSIPAVKLLVDGKIAGEFMGAIPEDAVMKFLDERLPSAGEEEGGDEADDLLQAGRYDEAETAFREAVESNPENMKAVEGLLRSLLFQWKTDEAEKVIEGLEVPERSMELLKEGMDFWRESKDVSSDWKPAEGTPPVEGFLKSAAYHAKLGAYLEAMENLLEIVKRDKEYRNGIGKRALVFLFVLIGHDDPAVKEYQTLLPRWLY